MILFSYFKKPLSLLVLYNVNSLVFEIIKRLNSKYFFIDVINVILTKNSTITT